MPKQPALAWTTLIGFIFGTLSWYGFKDFTQKSIGATSSKAEILSSIKSPAFRHTAKISGPLEVWIESSLQPPVAVGTVVTLRGLISSSELIDRVDLVWSVGPEFELISGATVEQLVNVGPESAREISIAVKPLRAGRFMVHLKASAKKAGISFSHVAQWATEREAKDFIMSPDDEKTNRGSSAKRQKVFH